MSSAGKKTLCVLLLIALLLSGCGAAAEPAEPAETADGAAAEPAEPAETADGAAAETAESTETTETAETAGSAAAEMAETAAAEPAETAETADNAAAETAETADGAAAQAVVFTDDLGREVTVENPQRVAALIGSFADIWCLAGGQDVLAAAAHDTWTNFELDLDDSVVDLGSVSDPSLETLTAAEPDLVLASCNTSADLAMLDTLEAMGITVAYFSVSSFSEYLHMLDICTQITGCRENYETYGEAVAAQIEEAEALCDGSQPTVLYIRASASSCKVKNSEDSVLGEMLRDLDTVNIADSDDSLLENLSLEAILAADPDYIFLVLQGSDKDEAQATLEETLLTNPAWQSLTAVQEGRCYTMDSALYNLKPNARWGEAYAGLAEILYGA